MDAHLEAFPKSLQFPINQNNASLNGCQGIVANLNQSLEFSQAEIDDMNYLPISLLSLCSKIVGESTVFNCQIIKKPTLYLLLLLNRTSIYRLTNAKYIFLAFFSYNYSIVWLIKYYWSHFSYFTSFSSRLWHQSAVLKWFDSYLSNRKQCVECNYQFRVTKTLHVASLRVLFRSCFIPYINYIILGSSRLTFVLFVDDTKIYMENASLRPDWNYQIR